jgi:hypothetical protein
LLSYNFYASFFAKEIFLKKDSKVSLLKCVENEFQNIILKSIIPDFRELF